MKKKALVLLAALAVAALTACSKQPVNEAGPSENAYIDEISGKIYVYEKGGVGGAGDFTVTLNQDGTYAYSEGEASSILGNGTWKYDDGMILLTASKMESEEIKVRTFQYSDGDLVYIKEDSDPFTYIDVEDGDIFSGIPESEYKNPITEEKESDTMWDRIPMIRVNGKLYYDTGSESTITARCGNMDGEITSAVDGTEIPTENNQSNFGSGFGYQYGADDTIEVYMNEKWFVFQHRDETE